MTPPARGGPGAGAIRLDLEGLRAVAIGPILLCHAGLPWFAGGFVGVDVFFVLSGFLVTTLLANEVARVGRVSLADFWAGRLRRILPVSVMVLAFSAVTSYVFLPNSERDDIGGDIVAAALQVVNWRLADHGADPLVQSVDASPVQQFWALAVGAQFYLVWPVLVLVVALAAGRHWRLGALATVGCVTVGSFVLSVARSTSSPEPAFFDSSTRIWELGLGAVLALAVSQVDRLPGLLRAVGGWLGLGMIAWAVMVFDESTSWPGVAALVPTVGAVLVIASGLAPTAYSPQRLLSLAPLVWIGGLAFSLYLWHWPILVIAAAERPDMRLRFVALSVLLSVVPAYLTRRLIEQPIRVSRSFHSRGRALGLGLALTVAGVGVGYGLVASASAGTQDEPARSEARGASALLVPANRDVVWSAVRTADRIRPRPADAKDDRPAFYDDGSNCQVLGGDSTPKLCLSGDVTAERTVVIVGDSKMGQWQTALSILGQREGFKLVQITKSACAFADRSVVQSNQKDCRAWGAKALTKILEIRPDLVITSQRLGVALPEGVTGQENTTPAAMVDGLVDNWRTLTEAGISVVALLDTPDAGDGRLYECVAEHRDDLTACAFDKAAAIARSAARVQRTAAAEVSGVETIDLTGIFCPDETRCPVVIGDVLMYRNGSHVTQTYIDSALPQLADALFAATDGEFGEQLR